MTLVFGIFCSVIEFAVGFLVGAPERPPTDYPDRWLLPEETGR